MMNLTLEMFHGQETPIVKRIELIEINQTPSGPYIELAYPSVSRPDVKHVTVYFLNAPVNDYCSCDGHYYGHRCIHLKLRSMALWLFKRHYSDNDDRSWLSKLELYRQYEIDNVETYLLCLLETQNEISQGDLLDLELRDAEGNAIDRRCLGAPFLRLYKKGIIEKAYQKPAQYATRKGGRVWVWRKCNGGK